MTPLASFSGQTFFQNRPDVAAMVTAGSLNCRHLDPVQIMGFGASRTLHHKQGVILLSLYTQHQTQALSSPCLFNGETTMKWLLWAGIGCCLGASSWVYKWGGFVFAALSSLTVRSCNGNVGLSSLIISLLYWLFLPTAVPLILSRLASDRYCGDASQEWKHTQTECPASFSGHCFWHVATMSYVLYIRTGEHRALTSAGRQLLLRQEAHTLPPFHFLALSFCPSQWSHLFSVIHV